ncbi:MAG: hypothetical protein A2268_09560 [Candidatus Raymondbacteria bacterium RifOxyA12_full_50_37]|uniref:FAD-binding PCMH-type domain-containing protein n=1 Tax=Candidatus Raymondbacteria bacterium RIFOXYD12_FULL_49_13 TaxID=1817890 RepID=A0A1F7F1E3_UNCRA|nr:MAG: hypothetical protein A2268_09560 [Candidatus Raymondbacteria bacterium RifOxyA12_full_50_37]OGJ93136.1 MAG: hypothetical protein A2350_17750 [Candidatus Raymondbacteria bacterium RifOxyB12_full_50_8]OGJ93913.1 MAG: hypothetical protein A2248_06735 [Candidatus Raymondbacteria bacterium RIFOXYA2_FULL_49_16]OGJ98218.1 MAG: hypothetical protein A2453_00430 [Candidatus Raymondbacteria bacterium RIFOXYC2_FULL_50_21]OGK00451.1 MAG: hypothetical protein A2519_10605 [Candidatus Raymondbacteria b
MYQHSTTLLHTYTPATIEELSAVFLEQFNKKQRFITTYEPLGGQHGNANAVSLESLSAISLVDRVNSSLTFFCGTPVADILHELEHTPYYTTPFDVFEPNLRAGYLFSHKQVFSSDMVYNMLVVMPDGKQISLGSRAYTSVAGYNAMDVFIGTKNTVGVPVRFTLKLFPRSHAPNHMINLFSAGADDGKPLTDAERKIILNLKNIYDPLNLLNTRDT